MFFGTNVNAQNDRGKVESLRIAYITEHLDLNSTEAQKFWPIYNQMGAELKNLRAAYKAESEVSSSNKLEFEQKKLDIKKKYFPQIEAAIGKEKANKLIQIEDNFKKELIKIMQNK